MHRHLLALVLLALPCAAFAQTDPAAQSAAGAKPVKEKKICRRDVATGSIMSHPTCLSAEQWQAIDAQNAATTQRQSDLNHRSAASNRFNGLDRGN